MCSGCAYLPPFVPSEPSHAINPEVPSWLFAGLKDHADAQVTDAQLKRAALRFPHNPPQTKEAYFFRQIFAEHFGDPSAAQTVPGGPSIACSTPTAIAWDEAFAKMADPSGRAISGVHNKAYKAEE